MSETRIGKAAKISAQDYARSAPPRFQVRWGDINWYKVSGGGIFLLGLLFTREVIALPWWLVAFPVAFLVQLCLSHLESPIFRRQIYDWQEHVWVYRRPGLINWTALAIDATINAIGVWAYVKELHRWRPVVTIAEILGTTPRPLTGWPALGFCLVLGCLVAAGFERLWYDAEYERPV